MIDVGRDDGAAARHLVAHEFRRDVKRHRRAEALAVLARGLRRLEHLLAAEIFALGDIDHFLGDDAGARPFELSERLVAVCSGTAQRPRRVRETAREMLAARIAVVDRFDGAALIFLDTAALLDPGDAVAG